MKFSMTGQEKGDILMDEHLIKYANVGDGR
jgi:hypothetical protein